MSEPENGPSLNGVSWVVGERNRLFIKIQHMTEALASARAQLEKLEKAAWTDMPEGYGIDPRGGAWKLVRL